MGPQGPAGAAGTGSAAAVPKNGVINGGMMVAQRAVLTLGSSAPAGNAGYGKVDRWQAWATGTAVSAGTATQDTASGIGRTGYAMKLSGVTLTGTGIVFARHRIEAKNSLRFKNQTASLAARVKHDVGSSINYTLTVRKANAADDFSATTVIQTGSATAVATGTETQITMTAISMGDCSNGIEIEVKAECGAITTKNFWLTEVQLEEGSTNSTFDYQSFEVELARCKRYFEKSFEYVTAPADGTFNTCDLPGYNLSTTTAYSQIEYSVEKRVAPTNTYYNVSGGGSAGQWLLSYDGTSSGSATPSDHAARSTHCGISVAISAVLTVGHACLLQGNWISSAEL